MTAVAGHKHGSLTMSALNTLKVEKVDLGLPKTCKAAVVEDLLIDVGAPDVVASTKTVTQGLFAIGNGENVITAINPAQAGCILIAQEIYVSDATPLPTVIVGANPNDREGPFGLVKDADGNWYITLAIDTSNCTALKSIQYRVDYTMEL